MLSLSSSAAFALLDSSTTVVSSANPSAFGQSVTFTATVTGLIITPTGTVTFKDGSTTLGTGTLNGSGQATFATSALTAGSHSITAEYGGDAVYDPSTSAPLTQTVNQNSSSTGVVSSVNPSALAQSVTFTATVTGSGGTPTGTVTFKDGSTTLGTGTLNGSGQATFATSTLLPGGHTITAVYGGDTNFATSTSAPLTQTVNIGPTTTAVVSSANPSAFGQSVTFTATVTGLIVTPTGTVTFKDGSTTIGTGTLNGSGQATFATSALTAGSHSITAVYGGDLIYAGSTSSPLMQTVNQNSSSTSVVSSVNPSALGQSVTFTATVTGTGGTPTGTVTFKDGSTTLGTGTLNGGGQATFSTSALASGSHSITAEYGGDTNFTASTSSPFTQNIVANSSSTTITSSTNPSTYGQSVTFTAAVTGPGGTPTGTVTFRDGTSTLGTATLNGSGQTTYSTSALAGGSHSITAVYNGDANFGASTSSPLTQSVNQNSSATTIASSVNPSALGQSVAFTATVTGTGGTPGGTVTFKDGTVTLGTSTLNGSGQATFATSALTAGLHSITAVYGGDTNFSTSTSPPLSQAVNVGSSTTTIASSVNPSAYGQSVTFTATVAGVGTTPTGMVTFKDGSAVLGTGALNGSGQATYSTSALTGGNHSITATYGGSSQYSASTSGALVQAVALPADSVKLRAMQVAITKIEAQSSGHAISSAVDRAIAEGFSDGGDPITPNGNGLRLNFAAQVPASRVDDAFSALGYGGNAARAAQPQWLTWADMRATGWNTATSKGDIGGGQVNALAGITHRFTPHFLVGVLGGYEMFNYTSQSFAGRLKGDGWTVGAYLGWKPLPGLRFDATAARSGISYHGITGAAAGSFQGDRWLFAAGLTGTYDAMRAFELEPSARVFAIWESEKAYVDSLGTTQAERSFMTGRASVGTKATHRMRWSDTITIAPYAGIYADYHFTRDNAATMLLPPEFLHGFSARATAGIAVRSRQGASFSLDGELGGIGRGDFNVWSVRGRAVIPF